MVNLGKRDRLGPSAQERMTASTAEKPKRPVARACAYTYQCVEHRGTTTIYPASQASMVQHGMGMWQ